MSNEEDYNQPINNHDTFVQEAESALSNLMADQEEAATMAFAMQLDSISQVGATEIGRRRRHNEDYFGIQTHLSWKESPQGIKTEGKGLYIVCDGMGGHSAGEVASQMAVEILQKYFESHWEEVLPDEETIREGILLANQKIHEVNQEKARSGSGRMGTTVVMALVQDTTVAIAHVGDSRAYQINRYGDLLQLTVDHEVGQREISRGVDPETAYTLPNAYQLTQALGPRKNSLVKPEIQYLEFDGDTLLLLCTDGLSDGNFLEEYGAKYLTPLLKSKANLSTGILDLIRFADERHGHDNLTGILVKIKLRPQTGN
jgi:protein phosphatase